VSLVDSITSIYPTPPLSHPSYLPSPQVYNQQPPSLATNHRVAVRVCRSARASTARSPFPMPPAQGQEWKRASSSQRLHALPVRLLEVQQGSIPERDHRQISRIAAHVLERPPEPRRVPYQELARKLKDEHAQLYPQHKYNLSAKERATKKVKEEIDDDELCACSSSLPRWLKMSVASMSPKILGSSEGGLLDQVIERKVNLKRPRSDVAAVEGASKGESQSSKPPVKKRKRNLRKPSTAAIPAPVVQSQANASHSPTAPFIPTNEIPTLALPPSRNSPAVKVEPYQELVLQLAAQIATVVSLNTLGLQIR
jgi:hypothetical protein